MSDRDLVEEVLVIERRAEELVRDLQRLRLRVEARIATGPRSEAWALVFSSIIQPRFQQAGH